MNQPDVPEVRGAAAAATPAVQEHPAGAAVSGTLEVSGRGHPGAAHRPERCEWMFFFFFWHSNRTNKTTTTTKKDLEH